MKTALKTMAAASVVLAAGFAQAQSVSVSGLDREWPPNVVGGSSAINIDQDYGPGPTNGTDPSNCLGFLQGITLSVPAGFTAYGKTYGSTPTWTKSFGPINEPTFDCGLTPDNLDAFGSGFRVIYRWPDATYSGSVSPGSIPAANWTATELVVVVDATFAPLSINLIANKGSSNELVYDLHP